MPGTFLYLDHPTKMTPHPVEYGRIVLSVSKMAIFRNRPDIFTFYLATINRILSSSSSYQFVGRTGQLFIQKDAVLKVCFLRDVVISSSPSSTGVIVCVNMMNSR